MTHPSRLAVALSVMAVLFIGGLAAIGSTPPTWLVVVWIAAAAIDALYIGVSIGAALAGPYK